MPIHGKHAEVRPDRQALEAPTSADATLERVVADLGAGVVTVLATPGLLDGLVSRAVIHDAAAPAEVQPGELVLGVGVTGAQVDHFVTDMAAGGAVSVLLKLRGGPSTSMVETAEREGVVLLGVAPEITWTQLHVLVRTSRAHRLAARGCM